MFYYILIYFNKNDSYQMDFYDKKIFLRNFYILKYDDMIYKMSGF